MRDLQIPVLIGRLWDGQTPETQSAVEEAIKTTALGMMCMFEAERMTMSLGTSDVLPTAIMVHLIGCKDPDFMPLADAAVALTLAAIGAHYITTERQAVMDQPLSELFPEDQDLFTAKGGEQ